jgi:hypothetical protein
MLLNQSRLTGRFAAFFSPEIPVCVFAALIRTQDIAYHVKKTSALQLKKGTFF